ncbi:MAG: chemotaxis protein CheW [Desulfobacteraceae bacterium 4572_89]|nr:MAG: chemotaxis protein CheW [Desulfobacteraceae bacterium 4572_89]
MTNQANTGMQENMELATFYVGKALCGIDILNIQEINKHFEVTTVPQAADYVVGVLNLRGRIVTILDLGKKLELSQIQKNKNNRNIIVRSQDEHIGLMVDSISDVVMAEKKRIEPAPSNISGVKGKFFKGVLKTENSLIGILDIDEVLKD